MTPAPSPAPTAPTPPAAPPPWPRRVATLALAGGLACALHGLLAGSDVTLSAGAGLAGAAALALHLADLAARPAPGGPPLWVEAGVSLSGVVAIGLGLYGAIAARGLPLITAGVLTLLSVGLAHGHDVVRRRRAPPVTGAARPRPDAWLPDDSLPGSPS